ncbi:hypothetical protein ACLOJK_015754 [Asimina triloba]
MPPSSKLSSKPGRFGYGPGFCGESDSHLAGQRRRRGQQRPWVSWGEEVYFRRREITAAGCSSDGFFSINGGSSELEKMPMMGQQRSTRRNYRSDRHLAGFEEERGQQRWKQIERRDRGVAPWER